jgi:hypothetical protein
VSDLHALLNAESERLSAINERVVNRSGAIVGIDPQQPLASADSLSVGLSQELTRLTSLLSRLTSLSVADRQEEIRHQLDAMTQAEDALKAEMEEVARAEQRFAAIALAVRQKSREEAAIAWNLHRAAVRQCYETVYPHKHLDRIDLDLDSGLVMLTDHLLDNYVRPDIYASTGQMNVVALAAFLGIALKQRISTLELVMLDEPVQNLDDIHFLAFMTLIKRIALTTQVIVSTADSNIAELFLRQMKSGWPTATSNFVRYEWQTFDPRTGPTIRREAIPPNS